MYLSRFILWIIHCIAPFTAFLALVEFFVLVTLPLPASESRVCIMFNCSNPAHP